MPIIEAYLLLLARRDEMSYDGHNKPYERQISDHKRKHIAQIQKGIEGKIEIGMGELEALIFTRPKVMYMLNI